jgi:hypothetical protein
MRSLVLCLFAGLAIASSASASPPLDIGCKPHGPVVWMNRFAEIPPAIVKDIRGRHGLMSDANGPFNATDVIMPGPPVPMHRLLRAARSGRITVVWYEAGGIAHFRRAAVYDGVRFVTEVDGPEGCAKLKG